MPRQSDLLLELPGHLIEAEQSLLAGLGSQCQEVEDDHDRSQ